MVDVDAISGQEREGVRKSVRKRMAEKKGLFLVQLEPQNGWEFETTKRLSDAQKHRLKYAACGGVLVHTRHETVDCVELRVDGQEPGACCGNDGPDSRVAVV